MRHKTGLSTEDDMLILPEMIQQERTDEKEYLPLVTQQVHHSGPWYDSTTSLSSAPRLTTAEPLPALEPSPLFRSITSALLPLVTSPHFRAATSAPSPFLTPSPPPPPPTSLHSS